MNPATSGHGLFLLDVPVLNVSVSIEACDIQPGGRKKKGAKVRVDFKKR